MIDVKNLSKSFGDHLVLDDITESIQVGEKVVIIGPSGSGKSTFLRCLNLLETPTKGTITFNGTEITDPKAKIDQIRQQMGMVFQHFNLFPNMTIRKNITLAPVRTKLLTQAEADDTATTLLRRVGLEDKAEIDQAITDILTSTDETERQELYDFVLTRLHEDAVYIPLTYETNKALYTSELKGVHFGTDQYDVDFASMYFE